MVLNLLSESQKDTKVTMTHIMTKAMFYAAHRNRRDVGRIKWGHVRIASLIYGTVLKSR